MEVMTFVKDLHSSGNSPHLFITVCHEVGGDIRGVEACVGEAGRSLLRAGVIHHALHGRHHQGEDQEEHPGYPPVNGE